MMFLQVNKSFSWVYTFLLIYISLNIWCVFLHCAGEEALYFDLEKGKTSPDCYGCHVYSNLDRTLLRQSELPQTNNLNSIPYNFRNLDRRLQRVSQLNLQNTYDGRNLRDELYLPISSPGQMDNELFSQHGNTLGRVYDPRLIQLLEEQVGSTRQYPWDRNFNQLNSDLETLLRFTDTLPEGIEVQPLRQNLNTYNYLYPFNNVLSNDDELSNSLITTDVGMFLPELQYPMLNPPNKPLIYENMFLPESPIIIKKRPEQKSVKSCSKPDTQMDFALIPDLDQPELTSAILALMLHKTPIILPAAKLRQICNLKNSDDLLNSLAKTSSSPDLTDEKHTSLTYAPNQPVKDALQHITPSPVESTTIPLRNSFIPEGLSTPNPELDTQITPPSELLAENLLAQTLSPTKQTAPIEINLQTTSSANPNVQNRLSEDLASQLDSQLDKLNIQLNSLLHSPNKPLNQPIENSFDLRNRVHTFDLKNTPVESPLLQKHIVVNNTHISNTTKSQTKQIITKDGNNKEIKNVEGFSDMNAREKNLYKEEMSKKYLGYLYKPEMQQYVGTVRDDAVINQDTNEKNDKNSTSFRYNSQSDQF